ncbi:sporulation peptidase YabG [Bacillus smithii]|uniref:sporulation peptidase YabG n=1 Tax=Bacillus smithii TaxID=1479 RepID=UPI0030C90455
MGIKINDMVGRQSYKCDLLFRVIDFTNINGKEMAILYGEDYRLMADAPIEDLIVIEQKEQLEAARQIRTLEKQSLELFQRDLHLLKERQEYEVTGGYNEEGSNIFQIPGKVLHLDGDPAFLKKCMAVYGQFGVPVKGIHCSEKDMPVKVLELLERHRPEILVITGHDSYSKSKGKKSDLNAYRNSKYFVQTVKEARKKIPSLDQLIIFAGACQSHFESLIRAGANFASSPFRVNIHALDPVYIVAKISYTPFHQSVNVLDVLKNTLTGNKGLGGVETRGVLRTGMPYHWNLDD